MTTTSRSRVKPTSAAPLPWWDITLTHKGTKQRVFAVVAATEDDAIDHAKRCLFRHKGACRFGLDVERYEAERENVTVVAVTQLTAVSR